MTKNNYSAMRLGLLDINKYIKKHSIKEVTNGLVLDNGDISKDGLFSTEIFGEFGSKERMTKFGYINLHDKFITPDVYYVLTLTVGKDLIDIIAGNLKFSIKDDKLVKDENGNITGINLFDNYWDKVIDNKNGLIANTGTKQRDENIKFLKMVDPKLVIIDKYLVIPAGLRDINTIALKKTGVVSYDEINDFYKSILNNVNNISTTIDILSEDSQIDKIFYNIQNTIYELFLHFLGKLSGKSGFLKSGGLVKKAINYSTRTVIVDTKTIHKKYDENLSSNIRMGEIGVPVSMLLANVKPLAIHYLNMYIEDENGFFSSFRTFCKDNLDTEDKLNNKELVDKFIDRCIKDTKFLTKIIQTIDNNSVNVYVMDFLKNEILRPIVKDKYALCTRYPINNKLSNQMLKPIPYTTDNVKLIKLSNNMEYELTEDVDNYGLGTRLNVSSFAGMGADTDGDTISIVVIFDSKTNAKIKKEGKDFRHNFLSSNVEPTVDIGIENLFGLNILTRDENR